MHHLVPRTLLTAYIDVASSLIGCNSVFVHSYLTIIGQEGEQIHYCNTLCA